MLSSLCYKYFAHLKPEHWIHHFLQVLEQVLDALHLPQEDVQLQPHLHLDWDGGLGLHPEHGVVLDRVRSHAVLELSDVALISLVEVRSRHECW